MQTRSVLLVPSVLLGLISAASAADGPTGSWRMTVDLGGGRSVTFALAFEKTDKGWTGKYLGATDPLEKAAVQDVKLDGDRLRFGIKLDEQVLGFDGKMPAAARQRISGSINIGDDLLLTALEPSQLVAFDRTTFLKEMLSQGTHGPALFDAAVELAKQATASKAKSDEVRAWAEKAVQAAEPFGVRWQLAVALRLVRALLDQPEFGAVALPLAQKAERLLDPSDDASTQLPVLDALEALLIQSNRKNDAEALSVRIARLEERDEREDAARAPFQPKAFSGRKGASNRAVLVELFTGAECPPCVAADLAFDALGKAYKPTEVIGLQYHLHVMGPDPMTTPIAEARKLYYKVDGAPSLFCDGKSVAAGGGDPALAAKRFQGYVKAIDPLLETKADVNLELSATRAGDNLNVQVKVGNLARPGAKTKLRVLLVEEFIRYRGSNGIHFHHHVVRGTVGPGDGTPLTVASSVHPFQLDLAALRKDLLANLEKYQKENPDVIFVEKPLKLARLRVVAFIQDDDKQEVLQAVMAGL
jgi:hypothetical protein